MRKMCCCECQNTGEYDNLQHAYEHGWFVHEGDYCSDHAPAAIDRMENEVTLYCYTCSDYEDWDMRKDQPLGWYKAGFATSEATNDSKWYCKCCAE
jgi:hypothetical protein